MNQILATNNDNNKKKKEEVIENDSFESNDSFNLDDINQEENNSYTPHNNYSNDYSTDYSSSYSTDYSNKEKKPLEKKKIITIFAICIAVFGIALIAIFASAASKNKNKKNQVIAKPEIVIEEDGNNAKIVVTTNGTLSKVTYYWDRTDIKESNVSGNKFEEITEIPNGKNTLYVSAQDSTGQITETTKDFRRDYDTKEPIIDYGQQGEGLLKIIATDETSMDYISYRWEDEEEETVIKVENEGDTKIETTVDASRGKNKIYITAVDTSGNIATDTINVQGALTPTIDVKRRGSKLKVKISHDKGFKKVEIYVNGEVEVYDEESPDYDENVTLIERSYPLQEGENVVAIVATSLEWDEQREEYTKKTYSGSTTYEPSTEE